MALVITIIILLILAGITILALTGDNGLFGRAKEAKIKTDIANIKEQVQMDVLEEQAKNDGDITKARFVEILKDYFEGEITVDTLPKDLSTLTLITKAEYGSHAIKISDIYNGTFGGEKPPTTPVFDENTLTIGEAINADKYGQKVIGYDVKTDETGGWRLFYQDSECTYLISDNCIGGYSPSNNYGPYTDGSFVGIIGQRLSLILLNNREFFIEGNTNVNIRLTAYLTDTSETSVWNGFKNGHALFAIGSPTIELFAASYNASEKSNKITLNCGTRGYSGDLRWFNLFR